MQVQHRLIVVLMGAWLVAAGCTGKVDSQTPNCTTGQKACGSQCKTVATDQENCGACGNVCGAGQTCQNGQCQCSSGLLACNGMCVSSTATHCGGCGTTCASGQVCSQNSCQTSCGAGETQCSDGACVLTTGGDALHCGGCNACPAGAACNAGVCACAVAGQMMCGSACVDTMTSAANCGGCGRACNGTCTNGVCATTSGTGGAGGGTGGTGGTTTACTPLGAVPRRLWRLSVEQWGGAVKDLLGLTTAPILSNRGGEAAYAFFSDATLGVDQDFQFALYQSSQNDVLPAIASKITTLAPCTGTTAAAQRTCAQTFATTTGAKAFRRPLDTAEVTNFMTVYDQGVMTDYATGVGLIVQAMITSPSFIYRTELGPTTLAADTSGKYPDTTLNPYEIASQLGFLFLGSLPDTALTAAAADGSIATTNGLNTQIDRLLALPAVKANLTNIMVDWFNVRQMFDKRNKDTALLSSLAAADQDQTALTTDLYAATQQFVNDVLWTSGGTVNDLVTSQKVFLNKRLNTLFPGATFSGGAPASNTTFVAATWPSSQGRSGLLTQPSFLWSASDPAKTSIVKRGKFIHDDIVCQDTLPPPIDLSTPQAVNVIGCKSPDGTTSLSTCDSEILQSDARMMYQPCKTCHAQMDLYSRVLQNFGPIGNYRTADEAGRAIDPSVTYTAPPLAPNMVSGSAAFGQLLASSGVIKDCSVQKMASYAMGNMIRTYNTCEVNDLRAKTDGTIGSLFKQVALASFLRSRAGGMK
jgi:Protein of unknown function (DUF1592)/Protein of unknown function (DUF1595)/Protein of unknown function (DUF1588)